MIDATQLRAFVEANPKLVTRRESTKYPGLYVLKYTRKVFYDALWNDLLEECRGLVLDADWNVVVQPFRKIYNRFERNTDIDRDEMVEWVCKVNGFMGAMTNVPGYGLVVSTTGSLDSPFVEMAEKYVTPAIREFVESTTGTTWIFEVCDANDPHIIVEDLGLHLIGGRGISQEFELFMTGEEDLDAIAKEIGVMRPWHGTCRFSDVVAMSKRCEHEGYVVYGLTSNTVLKIKSPYYLVAKFLARMKSEKFLERTANPEFKKTIDEEYYPLVDHLVANKDSYTLLDEQGKLQVIRAFLTDSTT